VALVALIILFPWLGSAVLPCVRPVHGRHLGRWALLPPAARFLITLSFVPSVSHGRSFLFTLPWFPELGVNLSLWVDGLSVFFARLIAGIGLLITRYPQRYLDPSKRQGRCLRCRCMTGRSSTSGRRSTRKSPSRSGMVKRRPEPALRLTEGQFHWML
jgi:formate hydrogenlyase subunit 3/multisubunit Na+/H+ antiporter MnhD subunit